MKPRALIVGAGGQDGQLLTEFLRGRGYEVVGLTRAGLSGLPDGAADGIDIAREDQVEALLKRLVPQEIYYLAAHHHSSEDRITSEAKVFEQSLRVNLAGLSNFLEAMRTGPGGCRLFYAASSLIFGHPEGARQDETTPINPTTAYGISKAGGVFLCRQYRRLHSVFAAVGILYNHESPLRRPNFLSKKIARGVADIKGGRAGSLRIGSLEAEVDWGYAPDYVAAMHAIVQLDAADDFIIASGEKHSVRDFLQIAFSSVGLDYRDYVETDSRVLSRSNPPLLGNPDKLRRATGWMPAVGFADMVKRLVEHEMQLVNSEPVDGRRAGSQ